MRAAYGPPSGVSLEDWRWDTHNSGVHAACKAPWSGQQMQDHPMKCRYAGKVERIHAHDFDGPLVCGCTEENVC